MKDLQKQIEIICKPKHEPLEKKIQEHEDRLNSSEKKIAWKADKSELDKKADATEVSNLKDWVSKMDGRMWGAILTSLFASLSALGALLLILLKQ